MKICMIVQDPQTRGGIAAVVNGYRGSELEQRHKVRYIESYRDGGRLIKLCKALSAYVSFLICLITDRPDVVHIHSSFGPSFYRKIPFISMAARFGIPVVNHIHGADFDGFYTNASMRKRKLIHKIYGKCFRIIALSDEWKERLSLIVDADRIRVIPNYSTLHADALDERLSRPCGGKVLFLGEIGERKGCHDIPAIAAGVIRRVPDARFIIGGAGTPAEEERVRKDFARRGITGAEFPGWVRGEDKDRLLREADLFFLPSYNEGMPMSILDAMGYALPVVSTDVGGIHHLVHDGINGFCLKPGDTDGLADAVVSILGDEDRRRSFSRNSFDIVESEYSLQSHLEKLENIYTEACHAKSDGLC